MGCCERGGEERENGTRAVGCAQKLSEAPQLGFLVAREREVSGVDGRDDCLTESVDAVCGNGLVEEGEECDCGIANGEEVDIDANIDFCQKKIGWAPSAIHLNGHYNLDQVSFDRTQEEIIFAGKSLLPMDNPDD